MTPLKLVLRCVPGCTCAALRGTAGTGCLAAREQARWRFQLETSSPPWAEVREARLQPSGETVRCSSGKTPWLLAPSEPPCSCSAWEAARTLAPHPLSARPPAPRAAPSRLPSKRTRARAHTPESACTRRLS
eukprot:211069-Prymnesium_polylepis.1